MLKNYSQVLLIVLSFGCLPAYASSLKICIEDKLYIPYVDLDLQKLGDGLLIQVVSNSAKQNKLQTTFIRQSWPRCLQQVATGKVDALMAAIYTPERATKMVFPPGADKANPNVYLWKIRYPFFVKKDSSFSFESNGHNIELGIGTPYQYVTYKMLADRNLLPAYDYDLEAGLSMVAAGRLDAYVVETQIGLNSLVKLQLQHEVAATEEAFLESYWHIAFNPTYYAANKKAVDQLWHDLALIRDSIVNVEN